jgi:hypothetical protein
MMETEVPLISPKLDTLRRAVEAGNTAALDAFWQEISQQSLTKVIKEKTL